MHIDDDLGNLDIATEDGLARDQFVFAQCEKQGLTIAAGIGGGYQRDIDALVNVHMQLFKAAGVF